jgi:hypothetical protein
VLPRRDRAAFEERVATLSGARFRWILYDHEEEIRALVRNVLAREAIDGIHLGPMPYDRCRDVLPADLPVAVPRTGAIELAVTFAKAMSMGWAAAPVSVDTIEDAVIAEVTGALRIPRRDVASLPYATGQSVDEIMRFHEAFHERAPHAYAITGRSEVARRLRTRMRLLQPASLPSTNRAVLHELALRIQAKRDSERHLAAGVFRVVQGTGARNVDRARAALVHLLLSTPEFADAWVENRGTRGVLVFAHKALLERATRDWTAPPRIGTGKARLDFAVAIGFGLGASARTCVVLAEHAVDHAEREGGGRAYLMGDRGLMVGPMLLDAAPLEFRYREHGPALEGLAHQVGLSPLTLSRLAALERKLADRPISPSELADAMAITDPSARRLMRALAAHDLAAEAGTSQRGRKGRPSRLWRLSLDRHAPDGAHPTDGTGRTAENGGKG